MEVSTFELLFKAQSPVSPKKPVVQRVIQGYFLAVTNLEDTSYQYGFEFVITPPPSDKPFRSLFMKNILAVDTDGIDDQLGILTAPSVSASKFYPNIGFITIPPKGTALLAVLPSIFELPKDTTPAAPTLTEPTIEIRGYVNIYLPGTCSDLG